MSRLIRTLPALALTLIAACAPAPPPAPAADPAADLAAINTLRTAYAAAANANDLNGIMTHYTADAVVMPNDAMPVVGHDAVMAFQKGLMAQFTQSLTLTPEETKVAGDWAFDRGQYMLTLTPKAAPDPKAKPAMPAGPIMEHGKYLVILQRQPDKTWKLAREMGNRNMVMAPPAAAGSKP